MPKYAAAPPQLIISRRELYEIDTLSDVSRIGIAGDELPINGRENTLVAKPNAVMRHPDFHRNLATWARYTDRTGSPQLCDPDLPVHFEYVVAVNQVRLRIGKEAVVEAGIDFSRTVHSL